MSNILVTKNYTLKNHSNWCDAGDRTEANYVNHYATMEKHLIESANKNLANLDEIVVHRGEADNIREVFKQHFLDIYELWQQGHNILYCDLDVNIVKPVEVFGEFEHFSMFNYTDPRSTTDGHYNVSLSNYFNCGVRYYPENMSQEIWDLGLEMLDRWNPDRWDAEQIIYNVMMWRQPGTRLDDFFRPELNWMSHHCRDFTNTAQLQIAENWNETRLSNAKIIHFTGTRGAGQAVKMMENFKGEINMGTYYKNLTPWVEDIDEGDVIEIGVDRGEGSTAFFIDIATQKGVNFVGVDAHPEQIENITKALEQDGKLPDNVEIVHEKGEVYLHSILQQGRKFSIVYLDNFDWDYWKGNGPDEGFVPGQRQMYQDVMNVEMSNMNSQLTHLIQAMNISSMLTPRAVVVCDDTWFEPREGIFIGKCSAALPFLLACGFTIVHNAGYRNRTGGSGVILKRDPDGVKPIQKEPEPQDTGIQETIVL